MKSVMVTSSIPQEGKTLTATNLALTLSESYNRQVLLIDGDLRRPTVHEIFGISNAVGLGDGLRSENALALVDTTPYLTVLPAGRADADPTAGLASERMRRILKEAAERFDWIVLDTPPVGLIPDARLIADLVDGVIFVIAAKSTGYPFVQKAIEEVGRERILGTVLNRVDDEIALPSGYYHQYYDRGTTARR
jgi:capsular exopolysaccharide synthesis family protein